MDTGSLILLMDSANSQNNYSGEPDSVVYYVFGALILAVICVIVKSAIDLYND